MFLILPYRIHAPRARRPWVTGGLVTANVLVFIWTLPLGSAGRDVLFIRFGFVPDEAWRVHTWLASMFLHGGWLHLAGNMYFLLIFGRHVEERLGRARYLAFYLAAGAVALLAHRATSPGYFSDVPCVGASGAISGVLGAFAVVGARTRVKAFYAWVFFLRPLWGTVTVPAAVFLGFWFAGQLAYGLSLGETVMSVQVAYWAHIGGFAFGAGLTGGRGLVAAVRRASRGAARARDFRRAMRLWREGAAAAAAAVIESLRAPGAGEGAAAAPGADGGASPSTSERDRLDLSLARVSLERDTADAARLAAGVLRSALARRDRAGALEAYMVAAASGRRPRLSTRASLAVAAALSGRGRDDEAEELLVASLEREPDAEQADAVLHELGRIAMRGGNRGRAAEIFDLLKRLFPDSPVAESVKWRDPAAEPT